MPVLAVVYPAALELSDGADHPLGTVNSTDPLLKPPVAAVYVNVNVFPVDPADTADTSEAIDPEPSAAYTVTLGELTNAVNALDDADVDFSRVAHDCAPVDAVAVAPDPVPALLPYTTLIVPPPANVTPVTVTT